MGFVTYFGKVAVKNLKQMLPPVNKDVFNVANKLLIIGKNLLENPGFGTVQLILTAIGKFLSHPLTILTIIIYLLWMVLHIQQLLLTLLPNRYFWWSFVIVVSSISILYAWFTRKKPNGEMPTVPPTPNQPGMLTFLFP